MREGLSVYVVEPSVDALPVRLVTPTAYHDAMLVEEVDVSTDAYAGRPVYLSDSIHATPVWTRSGTLGESEFSPSTDFSDERNSMNVALLGDF